VASEKEPVVDLRRRKFLIRCGQGVGASLIPAFRLILPGLAVPAVASSVPRPDPEFHLHPHYRAQRPLDATLAMVKTGLDDFVTETYADQVDSIMAEWSTELQGSPTNSRAIRTRLASHFVGSSFTPAESRLVRSGIVEIHRNTFASAKLSSGDFLESLELAMRDFIQLITAEFQVTSVDASKPHWLLTDVRYDLVGAGNAFYREQRTGYWKLQWQRSANDELRIQRWLAAEETRSRASSAVFADVAGKAFAGCSSYSAQLTHGSDYWRTTIDGACGIDLYGHNGISVGDIDNDGFDDLYVCQPAGLPNRLYRNRGDGTFEDITESSGVGILDNTACALFADIDNDGHQDLIVVCTSGPLLFLNQGDGKFHQKPDAFKFATPPEGTFTGAALADYDRDGWLDIYLCLYIFYQGTDQYKYPTPYYAAENGPPNFMMRNNRDGTFSDVTAETGLSQNNTRYSFCCGWNDYNGDGWPDLYVVNDFGRKNLYRNNGDGTFTDVAPQMGVEDVGAGMSVCWADFNNDGAEDLCVGNMWAAAGERISTQDTFKKDAPEEIRTLYRKHAMGNSLFRKDRGTFQDVTKSAGVGMGRWSWSSDAWDFDHDGYADVYVANGMVSGPSHGDLNSFFWRQVVANSPDEAKPSAEYEHGWNAINELIRADGTWSGYERNVFYANNGDGTFSDVSGAVGLDFIEDGRSFALADFDHDGRLEVFLKNRNGPQLRALKNVFPKLPSSISFRLHGTKSNRDAIGAVITIENGAAHQTRSLQAGSGFLSQHSKDLFFGLGHTDAPVHALIRWPSGLMQEVRDLPANHKICIHEGVATPKMEPFHAVAEHLAKTGSDFPREEILPRIAETWLLAPFPAPDFSLPDVNGKTSTLSALRGRVVLVNFWASQSSECQKQLNAFQGRYANWAAQGLQLITVNLDDDPQVKSLEANGYSFPILRGNDDAAGIYNIVYRYLFDRHRDLSLPTSFLLDTNGDIVKVYQGRTDPDPIEHDFLNFPRNDAERLTRALPFPGISMVPDFSRNYLSFGSVFFQHGYYDQAGASFQRALRDDPSSAEARYGTGSVYLQQHKNRDAAELFQRVTKSHAAYPDTIPNAWNNLGLVATREGRMSDAIASFSETLRLNPDHLVALNNLGNAYREQKQWEQARETLERAVRVGPKDAEAHYSLGMVYAQVGDTDHAYEHLQRALELRPDYPEALNNLGVLYLRTHRRDEAVAGFEKCIRVAPAFDQSYVNLAKVYALEGTPEKARAVLLDLLKQHPDHVQGRKMLEELGQR
jgi:tetratricopeptide (TPR) repeat protein